MEVSLFDENEDVHAILTKMKMCMLFSLEVKVFYL